MEQSNLRRFSLFCDNVTNFTKKILSFAGKKLILRWNKLVHSIISMVKTLLSVGLTRTEPVKVRLDVDFCAERVESGVAFEFPHHCITLYPRVCMSV